MADWTDDDATPARRDMAHAAFWHAQHPRAPGQGAPTCVTPRPAADDTPARAHAPRDPYRPGRHPQPDHAAHHAAQHAPDAATAVDPGWPAQGDDPYGLPPHHTPDTPDHDPYAPDPAGDGQGAARRPARAQAIVNWIGALMSIALIVGISVWGYRLIARDVTGVPVVRAIDGPVRYAPDDPGGRQAAYRGLAVNAVAADGVAAPAPEQVVLAPPPLTLDAPFPEATTRGLTNAAFGSDEDTGPDAAAEAASSAQPATRLDAEGRVQRSPMPPARPSDDLVAAAAAQAVVAALSGDAARATPEIDPATLSVGTRLVQLGAFDARDEAVAEWDTLATRFGALMEGRSRVVQEAESGGKVFYRLRAHGFADENDARLFCAALLAEQASCIPVLIR